MLNKIIIVLLAAVFAVSLITVITEYILPKNSEAGRIFRAVRIRLREMSRTGFCVFAMVVLVFGLVAHDSFRGIFIALGILLMTLIVLHPEDFLSVFRHRRGAKRKKLILLAPELSGGLPQVKKLTELTPLYADEEKENNEEGKDKI